jgi:Abortive infection C-terminus
MEPIHRSMSKIVDILDSLRNQNSLAHPNELLLGEAEAMLTINSVRTSLHYLNNKLA